MIFINSEKPADIVDLIELGDRLLKANNQREATNKYDEALACHPNSIRYSHKARALLEQGKYDQAISCCNEALKLKNNYVYAHFIKGNTYYLKARECSQSQGILFDQYS